MSIVVDANNKINALRKLGNLRMDTSNEGEIFHFHLDIDWKDNLRHGMKPYSYWGYGKTMDTALTMLISSMQRDIWDERHRGKEIMDFWEQALARVNGVLK